MLSPAYFLEEIRNKIYDMFLIIVNYDMFDSAFLLCAKDQVVYKSLQISACCTLSINVYLHCFWPVLMQCSNTVLQMKWFWHNFRVVQRHCGAYTTHCMDIFIDYCTLPSNITDDHSLWHTCAKSDCHVSIIISDTLFAKQPCCHARTKFSVLCLSCSPFHFPYFCFLANLLAQQRATMHS